MTPVPVPNPASPALFISLPLIFVSAVLGALLPLRTPSYLCSLTSSLLLSTALLHLFPSSFRLSFTPYPFPALFLILGFLLLLVISRLPSKSSTTPLLFLLFSFHAFLEGFTLSLSPKLLIPLTLAILAHKFFAALALSASISHLPRSSHLWAVLIFAALTPLGAVFALVADSVWDVEQGVFIPILNAVTAGAFMYVALVEMVDPDGFKLIPYVIGVTIMAVLAIFV